MKIQRTFILSTLIFALCLLSAQNIFAQGKFDVRDAGVENEVKGAAKFSELLRRFMTLYLKIESKNSASDVEMKELVSLGQNIKDGTSNFRSNLQGLVAKLKNGNRWNEKFDDEFANSIVSPRTKALFQNSGARKILGTEINPAIDSAGTEIDAMLNEIKGLRATNENRGVFFATASYTKSAAKGKFGCVMLGVGVAIAELAGAKLTAGNLDKIFDRKCGGADSATE